MNAGEPAFDREPDLGVQEAAVRGERGFEVSWGEGRERRPVRQHGRQISEHDGGAEERHGAWAPGGE